MVAPVHVDLPALGQCSGAALIRSLFDSLSFAVWVAVVLRSALAFVTVWRWGDLGGSFFFARAAGVGRRAFSGGSPVARVALGETTTRSSLRFLWGGRSRCRY